MAIALGVGEIVGGRFEVEAAAGSGGMASVFRARDLSTGNIVALKVIHMRGGDASRRLEREATSLADMTHPGIVRYVGHGPDWIAMEWLVGEDLEQRLRRQPLTLNETMALVRSVARALGAAHARSIVHRDVKPANLWLVDSSPLAPKLLDFGIAWGRALPRVTATGVAIGTPAYMAPEQARGEVNVDARADVFSLGCVLFECITSRPPFVGDGVAAVLVKLLFEDAPRLGDVADAPYELEAVVAKMLSKDPAMRYGDGDEVARALDAIGDVQAARDGRAPSAVLTEKEQWLASVLLIAPKHSVAATIEARAASDTGIDVVDHETLASLRRIAAKHDARADALADGTLVATLAGHGAPTDHAARAAACALELEQISRESTLALATGRTAFGAGRVGEAVDRAARLLRAPKPARGVRVDDVTAGLLDGRFEISGDAAGLVLVSEREQPRARTLLGKAAPFVGRERDLGTLEAEIAHILDERASTSVIVTAPAGVGKTRLAHELLQRARAVKPPIEVWIGRGDPVGARASFGLAAQMLRGAAGIQGGEPVDVSRTKLRARIERSVAGANASRVARSLGELIGLPDGDEARARVDSIVVGDQMRAAWAEFVRAEAEAGPLLLVLDDLHWGDAVTAELVDIALRVCRDKPLMALALGRPEMNDHLPQLWSRHGPRRMTLGALAPKAIEKLARDALGESATVDVVARITEQAQGNAFSLEELVRAHAEGRTDVPPTVLGLVESRMETLDPLARRVLRAASVFGQTFWQGGVRALVGQGPDISAVLGDLERGEWIQRRATSALHVEVELAFRHPLVREAAYAMLTDDDRALGHALAGEWLERTGAVASAPLAEHFERGGAIARAIPFWLRAAQEALEGHAYSASVAGAEHGAALGASGEVLGQLQNIEAEARVLRGDRAEELRRALDVAEQASALLPEGTPAWANAVRVAMMAATVLVDLDRAAAWSARFVAVLERGVSDTSVLASAARSAHPLHVIGHPSAEVLLDAVRRRAIGHDDPLLAARLAYVDARRAHVAGDASTYERIHASSIEAFERGGRLREACFARINHGFALIGLGRFEEAVVRLRQAAEEAERLGIANARAVALQNLSWALAGTGDLEQASEVADEAIGALEAQGARAMEGGSRIYAAMIALRQDRLERAETEARRAHELLEVAPPLRTFALAVLAAVRHRQNESDALSYARDAKAAVDANSVEDGEAFIRLVHVEVERAFGDSTAAHAALGVARDRVVARAAKISSSDARESFLTRVPEHARTLELAREWLGSG